ncbi:MAG TPA: kelch repeat-containing protein [Prolixibacteraceae bacterium]|nr:kelch repeat-containing protein [Prolixibacteraceae bacterium]
MKTRILISILFCLPVLLAKGQWSYTNLSESKEAMGATSLGTKAYFAGGTNDDETIDYSKVEIYDTKAKTWSFGDLSKGRLFPTGISSGSKVFFAGGGINNKTFDIVDIYDTVTQKWTIEHLSAPRVLVSAVTKGNKVLFAGGYNGESNTVSNVVDIYDTQTDQWSKDTLSMARSSMGVAVVGDLALFAGGFNLKSYTNRVDIYNFTTGKWTTDTLSKARGLTGVAAVGNKVLIAGGMTDPKLASSATDLVDIYDAQTGKWSTAKLSFPRCFSERAAVTIGDKVYFTGGGQFLGTILLWYSTYNLIDIYDNKTGTWAVDHLTHDVINHAVTVVDNALLIAGGSSMKGWIVFNTVEIFTQNLSSSPELINNQDFQIYPNPAKDILTIAVPSGVIIDGIIIYNHAGQKVQQQKPVGNRVNISKLNKGMYFLVLTCEQKQIRKKLIVD